MGIYNVGVGREHGLGGNSIYGLDTLRRSSSGTSNVPALEIQVVVSFAASDLGVGRMGLPFFALNLSETNQSHSFLTRLKKDDHILSLSFGYQAEASYRYTKVPGCLILGSYDRARTSEPSLLITSSEGHIVSLWSIMAALSNGTSTAAQSWYVDFNRR